MGLVLTVLLNEGDPGAADAITFARALRASGGLDRHDPPGPDHDSSPGLDRPPLVVRSVLRESAAEDERWDEMADRRRHEEGFLRAQAERLGVGGLSIEAVFAWQPDEEMDGVVLCGAHPPRSRVMACLRAGLSVLLLGPHTAVPRRVAVPFWSDPRRLLGPAAALRELLPGGVPLLLLAVGEEATPVDARAVARVLGWPGDVEIEAQHIPAGSWRETVRAAIQTRGLDLLALAAPTGPELLPALTLLLDAALPVAVLLVPDPTPLLDLRPHLEVTDGILLGGERVDGVVRGGVVVFGVLHVGLSGGSEPVDGEVLSFVVDGEARCAAPTERGRLAVEVARLGAETEAVGLAVAGEGPVRGLTGLARVLRPDERGVGLILAGHPAMGGGGLDDRRWLAVRFDGVTPKTARAATPWVEGVIDGSAVLDDGRPADVPAGSELVRLDRVARRLLLAGFRVEVVHGPSVGHGYAAFAPGAAPRSPSELDAAVWAAALPAMARLDEGAEADPGAALRLKLRALCGGELGRARAVRVQLENEVARARLLELLAEARGTVHLQTYMFDDDALGRLLTPALIAAGARGVTVRVLVDSLYSRHGSLRMINGLLAGLAHSPGVELRSARPVARLEDLKRRDHRKVLVVDGRTAQLTGRNLGAPYYTGWEEVGLTAQTPSREVPWLDVGVEVEGGIVAALDAEFARAWRRAGGVGVGEAGPVGEEGTLGAAETPGEAGRGRTADPDDGEHAVWLINHHSMRDAHTLEAYRALLESASSRVLLVNTFPLQFELQRVLLGLCARGVQVDFLVGNFRPLWGDRHPFPGEPIRELATQVVHGRLDPLVRAGADVRELALPWRAGWSEEIRPLLPHVHAKVVSVDGQRCAVGSANLDISAGYWESEALLVFEDATVTQRLDDALAPLFAAALRFDPSDPAWQDRARRRAGISRWWPSILG